jgi:hypothetical protein
MRKSKANLHFAVTAVFAILLFIMLNLFNAAMVEGGLNSLLDFGSFVASGQLANQGKNPYGIDSPLIFSVIFQKLNHSGIAPNLNPPISVLLFQLIADIPPALSVQAWRILSLSFYIFSLYLLFGHYKTEASIPLWKVAWALTLAGFWHTLELGQIYTFLLLLVVGIFMETKKGNSISAGLLLGILIAFKPNFIFWAIALAAAGHWVIFAAAGVAATTISVIPLYFYGFKIYQQWLEATRLFTPDLLIFPGNNSLQGLAAHFNLPEAGLAISVGLSIATLIIISRRKPALFNIHSISVIISLLISPIAWTGYTILTLPLFFGPQKWNTNMWVAACFFAIPFSFVLIFFEDNLFNLIFWGWLYGWGITSLAISEFKSITTADESL